MATCQNHTILSSEPRREAKPQHQATCALVWLQSAHTRTAQELDVATFWAAPPFASCTNGVAQTAMDTGSHRERAIAHGGAKIHAPMTCLRLGTHRWNLANTMPQLADHCCVLSWLSSACSSSIFSWQIALATQLPQAATASQPDVSGGAPSSEFALRCLFAGRACAATSGRLIRAVDFVTTDNAVTDPTRRLA